MSPADRKDWYSLIPSCVSPLTYLLGKLTEWALFMLPDSAFLFNRDSPNTSALQTRHKDT